MSSLGFRRLGLGGFPKHVSTKECLLKPGGFRAESENTAATPEKCKGLLQLQRMTKSAPKPRQTLRCPNPQPSTVNV